MTAVAVIGLGAMGSRIAARLVTVGHEVAVWNGSAGKAEPLAALGAFPAATPAEAAIRAKVLITMVADPAALRAVTEGPAGVTAGASGHQSWTNVSATAGETSQQRWQRRRNRQRGAREQQRKPLSTAVS
jgi:3-hydroxyisobutyrate dehydrogenase-like beta-hydroxyacid dehydrogenase